MALVPVGSISGLLAAGLMVSANGFQLSHLLTLQGLFDVGNLTSINRYSGAGTGSVISSSLLGLAYAASLTAPFAKLLKRGLPRLFVLWPVMAVSVYSTVTTERLPLLLAASMSAAGFLAASLLRDGVFPKLSLRRSLTVLVAVSILATAFIAIAFVRVGGYDPYVKQKVEKKAYVYAFGYLPAFSAWLEEYQLSRDATALGYGTSSVAGMSILTGQSREGTRAYTERVTITSSGATTNIYTGFRNMLLDFGAAGGALVLFVWGFITGRSYRYARYRRSVVGAGIMASSYAVVLLSNTMLVTTFSNVTAALPLAVIILAMTFKVPSKSGQPVPVVTPA